VCGKRVTWLKNSGEGGDGGRKRGLGPAKIAENLRGKVYNIGGSGAKPQKFWKGKKRGTTTIKPRGWKKSTKKPNQEISIPVETPRESLKPEEIDSP